MATRHTNEASLAEQIVSAIATELRALEVAQIVDSIGEGAVAVSALIRNGRVVSVEVRPVLRRSYVEGR